MICDHCGGLGYVEARDLSIDACKACAARAEAEWRLARPVKAKPVLRVVPAKRDAA